MGKKLNIKTVMAETLRRKKAETIRVKKIIKGRKKRNRNHIRKINEYLENLDKLTHVVERPFVSYEEGEELALNIHQVLSEMSFTKSIISGAVRRRLQKIQSIIIVVVTATGRFEFNRKLFSMNLAGRGYIVNHYRISQKYEYSHTMNIEGIPTHIVAASPENLGGILMYTTGNQAFLRIANSQARKLGLQLFKTGLYLNGMLISSESEESIFDELGSEYVPPTERDYGITKKALPIKKYN